MTDLAPAFLLGDALRPVGGTVLVTGLMGPSVAALLDDCFGGRTLEIRGAETTDDGRSVVVAGRSGFLGVTDVPLTATFTRTAGVDVTVAVDFSMSAASTKRGPWTLSASFPDCPLVPPAGTAFSVEPSPFLDQLAVSDLHLLVESHPDAVLRPAIRLTGRLAPGGPLWLLHSALGVDAELALTGSVVLPDGIPITTGLSPGQQPWELERPPPGILMRAELKRPAELPGNDSVRLRDPVFHAYCPPSAAWLDLNDTFGPRLGYTGDLSVPSAGISVAVTASADPGDTSLTLRADPTGVSVASLGRLLGLVGPVDLAGALPEPLRAPVEELSNLELLSVGLTLSWSGGPSLDSVWVTVGFGHVEWDVFDGRFVVRRLSSAFNVSRPLSSPSVDVTVQGWVEVAGAPVQVVAASAGGFVLQAWLTEPQPIPLAELLHDYLPVAVAPSDLVVDTLQATIVPGSAYQLSVGLAPAESPWRLDLGVAGLTVRDVRLVVAKIEDGPVQGMFTGSVAFGEAATLILAYDPASGLDMRGIFPSISVREIVSTICGRRVSLPSPLDLHLQDTEVRLAVGSARQSLALATSIEDVGMLVMELRRSGGEWGFAAGLTIGDAGTPDGLGVVQTIKEALGLTRLMVVISTFDDKSYQLPDSADFDQPELPALVGVKSGLTVRADWQLDLDRPEYRFLADFLGLEPTLAVLIQIGTEGNATLAVAVQTELLGNPFVGAFGVRYESGTLAAYLKGELTVEISDKPQTFSVELAVLTNGVLLTGSLDGQTHVEVFGVKIARVGLSVGVSFEGLPALGFMGQIVSGSFFSSVAVMIDTIDPSRCMVAGSVSDLTLADVVTALAGSAVPAELTGVLETIGVQGTDPFHIPSGLAADLDGLELGRVSEAFGHNGVEVSASLDKAVLVVGERGRSWFLTDLSRRVPVYYQLHQGVDSIEVSMLAQIYIAPKPVRMGSIELPAGFEAAGTLTILGWQATGHISIERGRGISISGYLDPLVIGDEQMFSLRAASGDGGATLDVSTFYQPGHAVEHLRDPHFYLDARLTLLGVTTAALIQYDSRGLVFEVSFEVADLAEFHLAGQVRGARDADVKGAISVQVDALDLGPLGRFDFNAAVDCQFTFVSGPTGITAGLAIAAVLMTERFDLDVDLQVDTQPAALARVRDLVVDEVTNTSLQLFRDVQKWMLAVRSEAVEVGGQMGDVLRDVFNLGVQEAGNLFAQFGYAADEIAVALDFAYQIGSIAVSEALRNAGFPVDSIGATMEEVYDWADATVLGVGEAVWHAGNDLAGVVSGILFTQEQVPMVLINRSGADLRVLGNRGGDINPSIGTVIRAGNAGVVGVFAGQAHQWGWVVVRNMRNGDAYDLFIQRTRAGRTYAELRWEAPDAGEDNESRTRPPMPPGMAADHWKGEPVATYTLFDDPPRPR